MEQLITDICSSIIFVLKLIVDTSSPQKLMMTLHLPDLSIDFFGILMIELLTKVDDVIFLKMKHCDVLVVVIALYCL